MPAEFLAEERELAQEAEGEIEAENVVDVPNSEEPQPDPNAELREIVAQQAQHIESLTNQITRLIQGGAQVRGSEPTKQLHSQQTYERFTSDPYKDIKPLEELDFTI